jgi:aminopeptidase N
MDLTQVGLLFWYIYGSPGRIFVDKQLRFDEASGADYVSLADEVITLDPMNPTMAARLVQPLGMWRRHDPARQALMQRRLERSPTIPDLSKNTYEMVAKSLA